MNKEKQKKHRIKIEKRNKGDQNVFFKVNNYAGRAYNLLIIKEKKLSLFT